MSDKDWTDKEVQEIVADYFEMFKAELSGQQYNKSAHRRLLLPKLNNRSHGSIEFKHANISAVLNDEFNMPYIIGYKPREHYQKGILTDIIQDYLNNNKNVVNLIEKDIERDIKIPSVYDILNILVAAPIVDEPKKTHMISESRSYYGKINYHAREAGFRKLGLLGEQLIMNYEKARLIHIGKEKLADQIEHTSEKNDGAGFDIHSFKNNGDDLFIEVKTTKNGEKTPFYLTRNELNFSQNHVENYQLYRLFEFRKTPKLFTLKGNIQQHCNLEATEYIAQFR